ncbi:UDP-N-acetylmuramoyl-L-alanyl-D-glutamate--2,6-diaminopimelate ligase [Ketogulonicigenium robustum]|uniref:UDP-N-acetylmuramoyl-L-alanyl-D-glutamate--2,6-diaminopimelate ligase n=1 Tax=Ketogulonicigenium robustum TaxID=92947 RepID=A0A1W6P0F1_9RHOB|nr:UDP-N-acetylmuramoyl-L-alanyl-D-glutamate--2,6-diaminopimelate ligase [Ketogulonicigenium robustum]ARO14924.1 UDP-N-acetylmuramoyl-L-alanyl-D-glutamate--2,6-diaminopimelate ligase [Ketogulonicigenium robustum]
MAEVQNTKSLAELGLHGAAGPQGAALRVSGIAIDSRQLRQGMLFAALPGTAAHGASYAERAVTLGATAILTDPEGAALIGDTLAGQNVTLVVTKDARAALAGAAALWFGPQPPMVVAVTGTNGKTSVTSFARQIWQRLGHHAINIGTTGVDGDWHYPLKHTTPDALTLQHVLAAAAADGVTHVAMEASSHGIEQRRLEGVMLAAAGFTNFSQDHLDYHKTFDAYFEAKAGLFTRLLPEDGVAVINIDDPKGAELAGTAEQRGQEVIGVGHTMGARLQLLGQRFDATGQDIRFSWQGTIYQQRLDLIGGFQADNVLLAAGLVIASGEDEEDVFAALPYLTTVRGRMQLAARRANGASVFVDFAHTPDAVSTVLQAIRPHVMGRIIAIVGAGGDRDRTKRPLMGAAAAQLADMVIVTDDNPRTEDPASIRAAVMEGAIAAGGSAYTVEIGDRAEAILRGVDALQAGDALIICGKGHESGQIVGQDVLPFDDVEQASIAVAALEGLI